MRDGYNNKRDMNNSKPDENRNGRSGSNGGGYGSSGGRSGSNSCSYGSFGGRGGSNSGSYGSSGGYNGGNRSSYGNSGRNPNSRGGSYGRRPPPAKHYDPYCSGQRADDEITAPETDEEEGIIEGRNAVFEALRAEIVIDKVYIAGGGGETDSALGAIASASRAKGIPVIDTDRRKLDSMSRTHSHQGVIAFTAAAEYVDISDILEAAVQKAEKPLLVLCDGISDPHNLGAIIRSCEAAGAHGVVIPKRRSASLTATVVKTSGGAVYHMPVARVTNMTSAITELKKAGVWVFGAAANGGEPMWQLDLTVPAAIVIGSEGSGISRLVSEHCDHRISIPMNGKIASLNASVSAAVLLYEAVRQRGITNG